MKTWAQGMQESNVRYQQYRHLSNSQEFQKSTYYRGIQAGYSKDYAYAAAYGDWIVLPHGEI